MSREFKHGFPRLSSDFLKNAPFLHFTISVLTPLARIEQYRDIEISVTRAAPHYPSFSSFLAFSPKMSVRWAEPAPI
jgi:hypothetical protein